MARVRGRREAEGGRGPSEDVEEGGREGAGDSPEKGGHPREQRCGSSGGASVGRTAGDLEQLGEARQRPAPHRWSAMEDPRLDWELGVRIPGRAEFWKTKTKTKTKTKKTPTKPRGGSSGLRSGERFSRRVKSSQLGISQAK